MYASDLPIGELLVKAGLVSQSEIDAAVKDSGTRARLLGKTLIKRGQLSRENLEAALQAQSLLRDGVIDSHTAFRALSNACSMALSFEAALALVKSQNQVNLHLSAQKETCKLGELLLEAGAISAENLQAVSIKSMESGEPLGTELVKEGLLSQPYIEAALELQIRIRDGLYSRSQVIEALSQDPCQFLKLMSPEFSPTAIKSDEKRETEKKEQEEAKENQEKQEATESIASHLAPAQKFSEAELEEQPGVTSDCENSTQKIQIEQEPDIAANTKRHTASNSSNNTTGQPANSPALVSASVYSNAPALSANSEVAVKPVSTLRLGELFVRAGILTQNDISQALELALAHGHPIGEMLVARGFITRALLDAALNLQQMVKNGNLSTGDASACMVKVFTTDRTVSECILELHRLKQTPPSQNTSKRRDLPELSGYFKRQDKLSAASRTVNELPAMTPQRLEEAMGLIETTRNSGSQTEEKSKAEDSLGAREALRLVSELDNRQSPIAGCELKGETELEIESESYKSLFPSSFPFVRSCDLKEKQAFFKALHQVKSRLGRSFLKRGEWLQAEELFEESLALTQTFALEEFLLSDLNFMACNCLKTGKSWQSEKLLKRSIAQAEAVNRADEALLGLLYHRLALTYCHLGLLFKAEKHFKKAAELLHTASLKGYLLLSTQTGEHCTLGSLLKKRLALIYKDHGVLLSRMRREGEADKYYCLSRKTMSDAMLVLR
ncbi:MAG: hypothetical protein K2Y32_17075 [Candidatus Obscuribacterales bacterium]|nr:hypothetical protein [Candidatus Obscuribacterales bacterium]